MRADRRIPRSARDRRRPRRLRTQLPQITADERRQAAEAGKPHQGGPRAYGYAPDRITIIDAEAEEIRECARRLLAGETLSSVANDLNGRKIVTAAGKPWRTSALKHTLTAARVSGRREYHGDITADQAWPQIITPDQSDQLARSASGAAGGTASRCPAALAPAGSGSGDRRYGATCTYVHAAPWIHAA